MGAPRVVLVDEDEACQARVEEQRKEIDALGIKIVLLDRMQKGRIGYASAERPGNEWRNGVKDTDATMMLFTRCAAMLPFSYRLMLY